ncbi:hypothetical protein BCR33DRAFT_160431 [Rhizoclosmatium globosum]|uniref:Uncharacterized protein n=1 Tax=Rhizoclosmatium globosum TaxID=329046 RepID=A0A1Y2CGB6_9FUNG|nr:hypothetical protein BCR33DRAFT_160431 [Rhizoclosmatium globosum]|eukprot:ORY46091.1 hypothetical protein BCR33DRAFT_160431 [Rhizoclosmatium globosum]
MDKVNTNKYIVSQDDPFNVPRWTGDALKESPVEGDNIHVQITKLLGGNPSEDKNVTFYDIPPEGQGLWLSLPWLMNREVAEKEKDWPKASAHLIAHRNDPDVKPLLEKAGLLKAIKPQIERFPDMHAVLYFIGKANLASDANLALLFGNEAWIRAGMMHVGMLIQSAPPPGSNYHAKIQGWLSLLDKTDGT